MPTLEERYDEAMFEFSAARFDSAIAKLQAILAEEPAYFDARLSLGMAHYRKGDYAAAIAEGLEAEKLRPDEQLVHTNLSLFYLKSGDKKTAEHHGLQARIASWKTSGSTPQAPAADSGLELARPNASGAAASQRFPDMPWKKKPKLGGGPPAA